MCFLMSSFDLFERCVRFDNIENKREIIEDDVSRRKGEKKEIRCTEEIKIFTSLR